MANGVIENGIRADEFRTRIPDKMVLNEEDGIFITDGNVDVINGKGVPRVVGKNIIDAVNDATVGIRFVNKATNATNVVLSATANNDGSTTIKAGTGSARVENCINAKNADVANWANNAKITKVSSPTKEGDTLYIGDLGHQVQINHSTYAKYASYASDDISKGTIEERLTNLGFRTGVVTGTISSSCTLQIQGKFAILKIKEFNYVNSITLSLIDGNSHAINSAENVVFYLYGKTTNVGTAVEVMKGNIVANSNTVTIKYEWGNGYKPQKMNGIQVGFKIQ